MSKKVKIVIAVFAVIAIAAIAFFGIRNQMRKRAAADKKVIKVGVILPLTGPLSSDGARLKAAICMAEDEQSPDAPKISFCFEDGKYTVKDSINAFNKLRNSGVDAWIIFGDLPVSGLKSFIVSDQKPTICLIGAQEIISGMNNCIHFSGSFIAPGKKIADYANTHNLKKMVELIQDDDMGKFLSVIFKDRFQKNGGEILFEERFDQGQIDAKNIVAKSIKANPDAIFVYANGPSYIAILNQLKQQNFAGEVLTVSTLTVVKDKVINGGEGFIFADFDFGAGSNNLESEEFAKKLSEKYALPANPFAAFAYEASVAMTNALKQHGPNAKYVCKELNQTKKQRSAIGAFSCHENGELEADIVIKRATKDGAVTIH